MAIGRSISRLASFAASIGRNNKILSGAVPDAKCHYVRSKDEMWVASKSIATMLVIRFWGAVLDVYILLCLWNTGKMQHQQRRQLNPQHHTAASPAKAGTPWTWIMILIWVFLQLVRQCKHGRRGQQGVRKPNKKGQPKRKRNKQSSVGIPSTVEQGRERKSRLSKH